MLELKISNFHNQEKCLPGIASNWTHATEKYGYSNNAQANNSSNSISISTLKCLVKYLSYGITTSIIFAT